MPVRFVEMPDRHLVEMAGAAEVRGDGSRPEKRFEVGDTVPALPVRLVAKGVVAEVGEALGLIPMNHLGDIDPNNLPVSELEVVVLREGRNSDRPDAGLLSRKDAISGTSPKARRDFIASLRPGCVVSGTVTAIGDKGVFIEVGPGVSAFAHLSELDWCYVADPESYVRVGETMNAEVVEADAVSGRLRISPKRLRPNPWLKADREAAVGTSHTGRVVRRNGMGLYVRLPVGIDALVHNSALENLSSPPSVGEDIRITVTSLEPDRRRAAAAPDSGEADADYSVLREAD